MVSLLFQGSQEVSRLTRLTGKQWHDNKTAFRPRANQTSWDKRTAERKALAATKAKEKEMKEEKEAERQVRYRATMSRNWY
jgi:rRNA-processing protein CGR1